MPLQKRFNGNGFKLARTTLCEIIRAFGITWQAYQGAKCAVDCLATYFKGGQEAVANVVARWSDFDSHTHDTPEKSCTS